MNSEIGKEDIGEVDELDVPIDEETTQLIQLHIKLLTNTVLDHVYQYAFLMEPDFKPSEIILKFEIEDKPRIIRKFLLVLYMIYKQRMQKIDEQQMGTEIDLSPNFQETETVIETIMQMDKDELQDLALEAKEFFFRGII